MDGDKDLLYICKSCQRKFGYILKHLVQSTKCKTAYTEEEISALRKESKEITRKNHNIERRYS